MGYISSYKKACSRENCSQMQSEESNQKKKKKFKKAQN